MRSGQRSKLRLSILSNQISLFTETLNINENIDVGQFVNHDYNVQFGNYV